MDGYSDTELLNWWSKLSNRDQEEIFEVAICTAAGTVLEAVKMVKAQWVSGLVLSPKQLSFIREFDI